MLKLFFIIWIGLLFLGVITFLGSTITDIRSAGSVNFSSVLNSAKENFKKIIIVIAITTVVVWGMYLLLLFNKPNFLPW